MTTKTDDVILTGNQTAKAVEAIKAHASEYQKINGAKGAVSKMSGPLLELAKLAAIQDKREAATFKALCKAAETAYKEEKGITNIKDALPFWIVCKSQLLAAMIRGVDPRDHDTVYSVQKAAKELPAPERAPRTPKAEPADPVKVSVHSKELATAMQVLTDLIVRLTDTKAQDRLAADLREVCAQHEPAKTEKKADQKEAA